MNRREAGLEPLMRSAVVGRLVHALLFVGPEGTGKRRWAEKFAQAMLCRSEGDRPCGRCPACRQVAEGVHPDLHVVEPEKGAIRVGAIRELVEALGMQPYSGGVHVALIDGADRMNESAQNALLKTLEAPVGEVRFLLVARTESALLPTIRSRCQKVRFSEDTIEDCTEQLVRQGLPAPRARMLAGLAQGAPGRAAKLDQDEHYFEVRQDVLAFLEDAAKEQGALSAQSHLVGRKDDAQLVMEQLELFARDRMALENGAEVFEQSDLNRLQACRMDGARMLLAVREARQRLNVNVTWTGVVDGLLFALRACARKGA